MDVALTVDEANAFFEDAFPGSGARPRVVELDHGRALVRLRAGPQHLRPGGYVSGPTQMSMVDTAVYVAIFTRIGLTPMAVTTSLNMTFLRPLIADHVDCEARLLKLGRTLAVAEVTVRATGSETPASHAVVTYALPRAEREDGGPA